MAVFYGWRSQGRPHGGEEGNMCLFRRRRRLSRGDSKLRNTEEDYWYMEGMAGRAG